MAQTGDRVEPQSAAIGRGMARSVLRRSIESCLTLWEVLTLVSCASEPKAVLVGSHTTHYPNTYSSRASGTMCLQNIEGTVGSRIDRASRRQSSPQQCRSLRRRIARWSETLQSSHISHA